jgi:fatty acid desaturase
LRAELKNELESAGLLGYRPGAVYLKAALLLLISVAFFAAFMLVPSWWLKVPLFLCGVSVNIGLVMMGHESGHGAISRRPFVNDLLGYVTFPLLSGLSHNYWRYKHNTLHHAYVNVDGKDPDIRIYPMAMNKHQRAHGVRDALRRRQVHGQGRPEGRQRT